MFQYISKILSQFSRSQRIVALCILLFTILIISIAPSFISAITLDRKELNEKISAQEIKITSQDLKIKSLENHLDTLNMKIRKNQEECTDQIVQRENEFISMLDDIKNDVQHQNKAGYSPVLKFAKMEIMPEKLDTLSTASESPYKTTSELKHSNMYVDEYTPAKTPTLDGVINKIDKMRKKIKK